MTNNIKTLAAVSVFLMMSLGLMSCKGQESAGPGTSTTTPSTTPTSLYGEEIDAPLFVNLTSTFENGTNITDYGVCEILSTDPVGTAIPAASCVFNVPELDLYYSDLTFNLGSHDASTCALVSFHPYFFQHSTAAAFQVNNDVSGTTYDCSAPSPTDPECYGGAAAALVSGFPISTGRYILPGVSETTSYTISSANTYRASGAVDYYNAQNNVFTSNNLVDLVTGINSSTDVIYAGGSLFTDYSVTCKDNYDNTLYSITFIVNAIPLAVPGSIPGNIYDWGN